MPTSLTHRATFEFGADALLDILTSPAFVEERERLNGAHEVRIEELPQEGTLRMIVHRTRLGAEEGGGEPLRVTSRVEESWELDTRACRWRLETEQGERMRLAGRHAVEELGAGSVLTTTCELHLVIAEMGPRLEQAIAARLQGALAAAEALVRRVYEERTSG